MLILNAIFFIALYLQEYLAMAATNVNLNDIEIRNMCAKFNNNTTDRRFQKIGKRLFYINQSKALNWFAAQNACRQMGGDLATPLDEAERLAIVGKFKGSHLWLGINNLANDKQYVSVASGSPVTFFKWDRYQPDKINGGIVESCILLQYKLMHDYPCSDKMYYVCQA